MKFLSNVEIDGTLTVSGTNVKTQLSTLQTNINTVSNTVNTVSANANKIKTYVGSDGKLHFTNASGADTALNFSSGNGYEKIVFISWCMYYSNTASKQVFGNGADNKSLYHLNTIYFSRQDSANGTTSNVTKLICNKSGYYRFLLLSQVANSSTAKYSLTLNDVEICSASKASNGSHNSHIHAIKDTFLNVGDILHATYTTTRVMIILYSANTTFDDLVIT